MKIGFIGDIVGRPARDTIGENLKRLREEYQLDIVIANYENASHGFGLTEKNCVELLDHGIDVMSGGNHSFDKKEILTLFDRYPLIRPVNYPKETEGTGIHITTISEYKVAIINLMGYYTMPMVDNPFTKIVEVVEELEAQGIKHIIIDMHAESTAEKQTLLHLLRERVSAIIGTHTHIGTDDLQINMGCCYVTDVGMTGCRDNVIGMSTDTPIRRYLQGTGGHFDIPDSCQTHLQMIIFELDDAGRSIDAQKIKLLDDGREIATKAFKQTSIK